MRCLFALCLFFCLTPIHGEQHHPGSTRTLELKTLLYQDCGSCHGTHLKGGLGPPLLPDNIRQYSDESLFKTIQEGRPGTPMPAWGTLLDEGEIRWIIQELRNPTLKP